MTKIKTILIDDEEKALKSLQIKLTKLWPDKLDIIQIYQQPEEALIALQQEQPELVFLDIEMPRINGFELLKQVSNPNFEIIFVTAYNNYAIEAIQHCAIGYVVKPIDDDELKIAVENALRNIAQKTALKKNRTLIENLSDLSQTDKKIIVPSQKGLDFIKINDLIRCEGDAGYTKLILHNQPEILSSYSIGKFVKMLSNKHFFQVHRSHLINLKWVKGLLNEGYVIMENNDKIPYSKSAKQAFIDEMNEL